MSGSLSRWCHQQSIHVIFVLLSVVIAIVQFLDYCRLWHQHQDLYQFDYKCASVIQNGSNMSQEHQIWCMKLYQRLLLTEGKKTSFSQKS